MDNREFEWDNNKERINKEKHNITFSQGSEVFNYPRVTLVDNRKDYGKTRYIAIGRNKEYFFMTVVYTIRDDRIRIISARTTNKKERNIYDNCYQKDE